MSKGISAVDLADEYFLTQGKKEPLEIFCYQKGYEQGREDERRKFANWCDRNGIDFQSQYYPTEVVEMYEEDLANGKIKEQKNDNPT